MAGHSDEQCPDVNNTSPRTLESLRLLGAHEHSLFARVYALTLDWQGIGKVMQRVRIRFILVRLRIVGRMLCLR